MTTRKAYTSLLTALAVSSIFLICGSVFAGYNEKGEYAMHWITDYWLALLVFLVIYYVLLVRAVLDMLRRKANTALLVFTMLGLIPLPPSIILGVLMIIIWTLHRRTGAKTS